MTRKIERERLQKIIETDEARQHHSHYGPLRQGPSVHELTHRNCLTEDYNRSDRC